MRTNVLLRGVGGQGTVTAGHVLARACLLQNWQIKKSEIHGMAQRGGSVESHLRFSPDEPIYSPLIPEGEADILLGFELLETLRGLSYVKATGLVLTDTRRIVPLSAVLGGPSYPTETEAQERLQASGRRVLVIPACALAQDLGEPRVANMILVGALGAHLRFAPEALREALCHVMRPEARTINLQALETGATYLREHIDEAGEADDLGSEA